MISAGAVAVKLQSKKRLSWAFSRFLSGGTISGSLRFGRPGFQQAVHGHLTPEQLGTFTSMTELNGVISDAADGVNAFTDANSVHANVARNIPAPTPLAIEPE